MKDGTGFDARITEREKAFNFKVLLILVYKTFQNFIKTSMISFSNCSFIRGFLLEDPHTEIMEMVDCLFEQKSHFTIELQHNTRDRHKCRLPKLKSNDLR